MKKLSEKIMSYQYKSKIEKAPLLENFYPNPIGKISTKPLRIFTYLPKIKEEGQRVRLRIKGLDGNFIKNLWMVCQAINGKWYAQYTICRNISDYRF